MNYKLNGTKTTIHDVDVSGRDIFKIFSKAFKEITGLDEWNKIKDGNLIETSVYYGHNEYYEESVVRKSTLKDEILLELRKDIYDKLCKEK